MKKIEIITKSHGKKKSQVIKAKNSSNLITVLGITNYCMVKDKITDIDLTGSVTFKVDGDKVSLKELREMIKKEIKKNKDSKDDKVTIKSKEQETDENGRIIIHSRKSLTFNKMKNSPKNKKKKKNDKKLRVSNSKKKNNKKNKKGKKRK